VTTQSEALRLAEEINALFVSEWGMHSPMAEDSKVVLEELRRLHAVNGELLEALKQIVNSADDHQAAILTHLLRKACAAIERAEGQA
jgi:HPt (histidine-containing phosphotransfer) domain-containing protein